MKITKNRLGSQVAWRGVNSIFSKYNGSAANHVMLMSAIQREFGQHVPVEDAIEVTSIADLQAILDRLKGAAA